MSSTGLLARNIILFTLVVLVQEVVDVKTQEYKDQVNAAINEQVEKLRGLSPVLRSVQQILGSSNSFTETIRSHLGDLKYAEAERNITSSLNKLDSVISGIQVFQNVQLPTDCLRDYKNKLTKELVEIRNKTTSTVRELIKVVEHEIEHHEKYNAIEKIGLTVFEANSEALLALAITTTYQANSFLQQL